MFVPCDRNETHDYRKSVQMFIVTAGIHFLDVIPSTYQSSIRNIIQNAKFKTLNNVSVCDAKAKYKIFRLTFTRISRQQTNGTVYGTLQISSLFYYQIK